MFSEVTWHQQRTHSCAADVMPVHAAPGGDRLFPALMHLLLRHHRERIELTARRQLTEAHIQ